VAYYTALCRTLRAAALESGLNPDTALPEDILLLNKDDKGGLTVFQELAEAESLLKYDAMASRMQSQQS
jgi:hypothetical protein